MGATNGKDVYEVVRSLGKFKHMERTTGISTSEIKWRIVNDSDNIARNLHKREKSYLN
jgi:hypothetical protein